MSSENGAASIAAALLATLDSEYEGLQRLRDSFDLQLEAIRTRHQDSLERATHLANDEVENMMRLRQTRERQMRLLGRVLEIEGDECTLSALSRRLEQSEASAGAANRLREARRSVQELARETQGRCGEVEFALQFAVKLGREMIEALQGLDASVPARVYTSAGGAGNASAPRSLLNRLG